MTRDPYERGSRQLALEKAVAINPDGDARTIISDAAQFLDFLEDSK